MTSAKKILLLLPPSEGKAADGDGPAWSPDLGAFGTELAEARIEVTKALRRAHGGDEKLLGVKGPHFERAVAANLSMIGAATLPAWQRYTGVVWEHLDPGSLRAADRRRLLVFSGALGMVRGDDPVPDYRLKMGGRLAPLGTMSAWWQPHLSTVINNLTRRHLIVEMLANEQRAAYVAPATGTPGTVVPATGTASVAGMTVTLMERDGKSGGHAAKAAKGLLARHLIEQGSATGLDEVDEMIATWRDERFVASAQRW